MTTPPITNKHELACRRKTRYADEMCARAGAMHQLEVNWATITELWVYRCPTCLGWHMTKRNHDGEAIKLTAPVENERSEN